MLQVGIVGCGAISQVHAKVLASLPEVRLTACADVCLARAQALGAQYACHAYVSLEDMLNQEKLDSIHLCTPHYLHTPMTEICAKKGIAVFMEKPPVVSEQQWDDLRALKGSAPMGVCFQNRYNANYQAALQMIGTESIGKVKGARAIVTWRRALDYYTQSDWRGTWQNEGGGVLINQSIHMLDQLLGIMGKPTVIDCTMAQHHLKGFVEVEDTVAARFEFGDATALFYASTGFSCDAPVQLDLYCEHATLRLENNSLTIHYPNGFTKKQTYPQNETLGKGYWGNGHFACIQDFYNHINSGIPYPNDLASVENTVQVMLEMYRQGKCFIRC